MIVQPRSGRPGSDRAASVRSTRLDEEGMRSICARAARLHDTIRDAEMLRGAMRRHVERCRTCRETMLVQEPTTLFRRLPRVELSAGEIAEMRQRVKGVRRARRVTGASGGAPSHRSAWVAAAATMLLLGGLAVFELGLESGPAAPMGSADAALAAAPGFGVPGLSALSAEDEARLDSALAARALIESDDVLSEQVVLMQVASRASDLAWVANDRLDL